MLNVSESTKSAWTSSAIKKVNVYIENDDVQLQFGDGKIVEKSMKLSQSLMTSEFKLGNCDASSFEIELIDMVSVERGTPIRVTVQAGETDVITLFTGYIHKIQRGGYKNSKKVTAYDWMYFADEIDVTSWYTGHALAHTVTDLVSDFVTYMSDKLPITLASSVTWASNEIEFSCGESQGYLPENLTAKSFLINLCEVNGCFGRINGQGKFDTVYLKTIPITQNPDFAIPYYKSFYLNENELSPKDGVIITNTDDLDWYASEQAQETCGVRHYGTCANPYIIQANEFSNDWTLRKSTCAEIVYNQIKDFGYISYESENMALPFLECGDVIKFVDVVKKGNDTVESIYYVPILERTMSMWMDKFTADASEEEAVRISSVSKRTLEIANNYAQKLVNNSGGGGGDVSNKMDKVNPVGSGSMSMNRKSGTTIGNTSTTFGGQCTASGEASFAEGGGTTASGSCAHSEGAGTTASNINTHAEGAGTTASGANSHAEGVGTTASGDGSHAEGASTTASQSCAHAEGANTIASGLDSHAEGYQTSATGEYSHAEGYVTTASGDYSHAEGSNTTASGKYSHSEGHGIGVVAGLASGDYSHVEGDFCVASGAGSHAEGYKTEATKDYAHAEGCQTQATSYYSHTEGQSTVASNSCAHAGGYNTKAKGYCSFTHGQNLTADGSCDVVLGFANTTSNTSYCYIEGDNNHISGCSSSYYPTCESHVEGYNNVIYGSSSDSRGSCTHVEGYSNTVTGGGETHVEGYYNNSELSRYTHIEGSYNTSKSSDHSHFEGNNNIASDYSNYVHVEGSNNTLIYSSTSHVEGYYNKLNNAGESHVEGYNNTATASYVHAEGSYNTACNSNSHVEGYESVSSGYVSHAEGYQSTASGYYSHSEGYGTKATDKSSHAEGYGTTSAGLYAHAEGYGTVASGKTSHAEGSDSKAYGENSHAGGDSTISPYANMTTIGILNIPTNGDLFEIGNGTREEVEETDENGNVSTVTVETRSNAFSVSSSGRTTTVDIYASSSITSPKVTAYTSVQSMGSISANGNITSEHGTIKGTEINSENDVIAFKGKDNQQTLSSKITEAQANTLIATAIGKLTYLSKEVATQDEIDGYIADPTTAEFNVIYLLKDDSASGTDKYFEYQRLGDNESSTFVCTGDTSTDLSDYTKTKDLAKVATSGSYNDLSDKPAIPSKTSDITNDSGFITSASLPTKTSDLTNDSGFITSSDVPAVKVDQLQTSGVHIADITVGTNKTEIYAPQGGTDLPISVVNGALCITFEEAI